MHSKEICGQQSRSSQGCLNSCSCICCEDFQPRRSCRFCEMNVLFRVASESQWEEMIFWNANLGVKWLFSRERVRSGRFRDKYNPTKNSWKSFAPFPYYALFSGYKRLLDAVTLNFYYWKIYLICVNLRINLIHIITLNFLKIFKNNGTTLTEWQPYPRWF